MRLRLAAAFLVLIGLTWASPAAAQIDTSTPEGQISQAMLELRLSLAADDVDRALSHYWNDRRLVVIEPDEAFKIEGYHTLKQYLEDRRGLQKTILWRTRHRKVNVRGDNAYVTFYDVRQTRMGKTVVQKHERGTYVLKRMDGKWLIVSQHVSALPSTMLFQQTK
jgi:ketosteroid isomerase-like protein